MKRYAILIGSSRFDKEPKLKPLRCPENDVDGMYEIVRRLSAEGVAMPIPSCGRTSL